MVVGGVSRWCGCVWVWTWERIAQLELGVTTTANHIASLFMNKNTGYMVSMRMSDDNTRK